MESTKAAMRKHLKKRITERLKKQELIKMKPALKAGFVFGMSHSTNVTAGQAALQSFKAITLPSFILPILNNIVFVN
jgi:hypothetical protein